VEAAEEDLAVADATVAVEEVVEEDLAVEDAMVAVEEVVVEEDLAVEDAMVAVEEVVVEEDLAVADVMVAEGTDIEEAAGAKIETETEIGIEVIKVVTTVGTMMKVVATIKTF